MIPVDQIPRRPRVIEEMVQRIAADDTSLRYAEQALNTATCIIEREVWAEEATRRSVWLEQIQQQSPNQYDENSVSYLRPAPGSIEPVQQAYYALKAALERLLRN